MDQYKTSRDRPKLILNYLTVTLVSALAAFVFFFWVLTEHRLVLGERQMELKHEVTIARERLTRLQAQADALAARLDATQSLVETLLNNQKEQNAIVKALVKRSHERMN